MAQGCQAVSWGHAVGTSEGSSLSQALDQLNSLSLAGKIGIAVLCTVVLFVFQLSMTVGRKIRERYAAGVAISSVAVKRSGNEYVELHQANVGPGFAKDEQVWLTITAPGGDKLKVRGVLFVKFADGAKDILRLPSEHYSRFISENFFESAALEFVRKNPEQNSPHVSIHVEKIRTGVIERYWNNPKEAERFSFRTAVWLTVAGFMVSVGWTYLYDCALQNKCVWPIRTASAQNDG